MLKTRAEVLAMLKVSPGHLSKIVNGKVKGLPRLRPVNIGRRQLFREETVNKWLAEVEESAEGLPKAS